MMVQTRVTLKLWKPSTENTEICLSSEILHSHRGTQVAYVCFCIWCTDLCVCPMVLSLLFIVTPPTHTHVSLLCPRGLKTTADKTLLHHPLYKSCPMLAVGINSLSFCHLSCVNIFGHLCSAFLSVEFSHNWCTCSCEVTVIIREMD